MIRKSMLKLVLLAVSGAAASSLEATPVLFAVTQTGSLYSVNQTTYVPTLVGTVPGTPSLIGLATDILSNKLYAFDRNASNLLQIDSTNGSILTTTNLGMTAGTLNEGDLAFNPASAGTGYIASSAFPISSFWSFTTTAGSGSQIRTCNTNPCSDTTTRVFIDGLAFNNAGSTLYALQQGGANLYTMNTATGVPTVVGATGVTGSYSLGALARRPTDDAYFALLSNNSLANLYSIDVSTGVATSLASPLGSLGTVTGLAFVDVSGPPPAVPEPATLWTVAAALLYATVKKYRRAIHE
jgi:hypothetical protein